MFDLNGVKDSQISTNGTQLAGNGTPSSEEAVKSGSGYAGVGAEVIDPDET